MANGTSVRCEYPIFEKIAFSIQNEFVFHLKDTLTPEICQHPYSYSAFSGKTSPKRKEEIHILFCLSGLTVILPKSHSVDKFCGPF